MRDAGSGDDDAPKRWSRWRVHVSVRRGGRVRQPEHARYAIAFAERELGVCRTRSAALALAGVAGLAIAAMVGSGSARAASSVFAGSAIGEWTAPARLRRSIDANRRLLTGRRLPAALRRAAAERQRGDDR